MEGETSAEKGKIGYLEEGRGMAGRREWVRREGGGLGLGADRQRINRLITTEQAGMIAVNPTLTRH